MNDKIAAWFLLPGLSRFEDATLLFARIVTGSFLIYGVWDNISEVERMAEFSAFLAQNGFWMPDAMAALSVWVQFFVGVCLVTGFLTRWAGILCVLNFLVACAMVHWTQDFRGWWPAVALVLLGLIFATRGAGRYSVDRILGGS